MNELFDLERERNDLIRQSLKPSGPVCFVRMCNGLAKIEAARKGFCDTHADKAMAFLATHTEQERFAEYRLTQRLREMGAEG